MIFYNVVAYDSVTNEVVMIKPLGNQIAAQTQALTWANQGYTVYIEINTSLFLNQDGFNTEGRPWRVGEDTKHVTED